MIAPAPNAMPAQPLGYGQDQRSQYLAQALQSMRGQPQTSPGGVAENLMSEALLQAAQRRQQNQPPAGATPPAPNNILSAHMDDDALSPGLAPNQPQQPRQGLVSRLGALFGLGAQGGS